MREEEKVIEATVREGWPAVCKSMLDALIYGVNPCTTSDATLGCGRDLNVVICGVELSYLDAVVHGVIPLGPKLSFCHLGVQM